MKGGRFLFPAILKTLILPPLLTHLLLRFTPIATPVLLKILLYVAAWPLLFVLRSHVSLVRSTRAARKLGARPIPRFRGRWPLNLDVLVDWSKSGSEEEVGRMMVLLSREYGGTYNTRVLGEDQIITSDPRVVRHVLIDDFDNFVKGAKFRGRAEGFLGDGIFNADGDRWKFHRHLTRPFFHPAHVNPSLFIPHITAFLSALPCSSPNSSRAAAPVDIQERIGHLALDIALDWLCGETPSSVHSRGQEWDEARRHVGEAMREAQRVVGRRVKIGTPWPLFELGKDPLKGSMQIIRAFFMPLILEAIDRSGANEDENTKIRLIDRLVEATHGDERLILDQLVNILLAAKDTRVDFRTASLLTFCTYVLALHPEVQDRVYTETMAHSPSGMITKEQIGKCVYTRQVINETLRLFPPVPLNIRRSLRPSLLPCSTSLPDPLVDSNTSMASRKTSHVDETNTPMYMPGNTSIIINTIQLQRDPAVWGEDALEFKPERWNGRGGSEGFAAWNLGPRMCLGQPFALAATHTFLIMLMRHLSPSDESVGSKRHRITLVPGANAVDSRMPPAWRGAEGDGRAREGRDRVWVVADVVLAVKGGLWIAIDSKPDDGLSS